MPEERKSSRLAKRTMKAALSDDCKDDSDSDFDEDEVVNQKGGSVAKRKVPGKAGASSSKRQPPKKKFRGMRGLLSNVVDMPVDILFEIFGHLLPIDLWNLARTNKDLRKILMSRSSAFVWRQARENDSHVLPDCPSYMSEPEFAALCYAKHCTTCLRVTGSPYYIWAEGVRLCRRCVDKVCEQRPDDLDDEYVYGNILPRVQLPGREPEVYYTPAVNALRRAVKDAEQQDNDRSKIQLSTMVDEMEEKEIHADDCIDWLRRRNNHIEAARVNLVDQRRAEIIAHAKQLGWSDELVSSNMATVAIRQCSAITKACHKKITEQTLGGLDETLNTLFGDLQDKHSQWKVEKKLRDRIPLLDKIRNECASVFPLNVPIISSRDLFHIPTVHSLIVNTPFSTTMTKEMLAPVAQDFSVYTQEWQTRQKETLLRMIEQAYGPEYVTETENVFDLAMTSFRCSLCRATPLRPQRAMVHHHCTVLNQWEYEPPRGGMTEGEKLEAKIVGGILRQQRWNSKNAISFDKGWSKVLGSVIELCGLDPKTTTVEDMNQANPIFECLACNSVYRGRKILHWSRIIYHSVNSHAPGVMGNSPAMKLKVLDGPELAFVLLQLSHSREKMLASQGNRDSACVECRLEGNVPDLQTHWKHVHQRPAGDGDIVRKLDINDEIEEYLLWPPRNPEELSLIEGTEITL